MWWRGSRHGKIRNHVYLTDEQKAQISALKMSWVNEAMSTARADRYVSEACIDVIYDLVGLPKPKKRWVSSPLSALIDAGADIKWSIAYDLQCQQSVRMCDIVETRYIDIGTVLPNHSTRLFLPVDLATEEEEALHLRMRRRPPSWQIRRINALIDERIDAVADIHGWPRNPDETFMRGALDPFSVFKAEVLASVLEFREADPLRAFAMLARSAGYVLPLEECVWLCERFTVIRRERNGLLHASDGPALDWGGTMPFYMWHGEEVTRRSVGPVEEMRIWDFGNERNHRARDLMLERYGLDRYIRQAGKRVQQDETGTLWRAGAIWAVEVVNGTPEANDGSFRRFFLRVPPSVRTAREGVAWTYGLRRRDYRVQVRT